VFHSDLGGVLEQLIRPAQSGNESSRGFQRSGGAIYLNANCSNPLSSPIGFREFNEDDYHKFIRTLSDEELFKAGKPLRILCGDVVTPMPSTFDRQLKICREEYRSRHQK